MFLGKVKDSMIEVKVRYTNVPKITKNRKDDFFIYSEVLVQGHAEHTGYVNNTRVCAGISACTLGIIRLLDVMHHVDYHKGYFHVWIEQEPNNDFKNRCDKESVYALNTLVCQLYEIYKNYPNAFKRFDLIEEKENQDEETRKSKPYTKHTRKCKYNTMGLYSITKGPNLEED